MTALVGKNESGKTAVLEAMYRANPIPGGYHTDFDELRDYPRRFRARDRKAIPLTSPVRLRFELDDADVDVIEQKFGPNVLADKSVELSRKFNSASAFVNIDINESAALKHVLERSGLDVNKYAKATRGAAVEALRADNT